LAFHILHFYGLDDEVNTVCQRRTCPGDEWDHLNTACQAEMFTIRAVGKRCGAAILNLDIVVLHTNAEDGVVAKRESLDVVSGRSCRVHFKFEFQIYIDPVNF
jgi:hypothetical protein